MNDKELADAIVALGVRDGANEQYYTELGINHHTVTASEFVRDPRVAMALMERVDAHFIERLSKLMWAVRSDKPYGDGKTREWYENESLPRAITEACVEALT